MWPRVLGCRRTPMRGQHIPFKTVTNRFSTVFVFCKPTEICPFMWFGILPNFKVKVQFSTHCETTNTLNLRMNCPRYDQLKFDDFRTHDLIFSVKVKVMDTFWHFCTVVSWCRVSLIAYYAVTSVWSQDSFITYDLFGHETQNKIQIIMLIYVDKFRS